MHFFLSYLRHWLYAVNQHSLHAPFVFDFYTRFLHNNYVYNPKIETLRKILENNNAAIAPSDFGAGYRLKSNSKSIGDLAKSGLSHPWFSSLFVHLINYYNCKTVVELGTSFGINSCYLASSDANTVYTLEGHAPSCAIASHQFSQFEMAKDKLSLIEGDIDKTLPALLDSIPSVDFALLDANHTCKATLQYFDLLSKKRNDLSIFIIDDIHWSKDMSQAWDILKEHTEVTLSLDLFYCGILFFQPEFTKSHFRLQTPVFVK